MTEQSRDQLVTQLKAEVHRNPDLTAMDDEQLRALIDRVLENKIQWARTSSPEAYRELSSMNFRERRSITGAVLSPSAAWACWVRLSPTPTSPR